MYVNLLKILLNIMIKFKIIVALLLCFNIKIISANIELAQNSLLMVHALFRHGERTTDSFYPTDPYSNETFYPIGKGGLTNLCSPETFLCELFGIGNIIFFLIPAPKVPHFVPVLWDESGHFQLNRIYTRGKLQEYQLGEFLRQRYDKFLGNFYTDEVMKVRSTGFLRTRMSALLVAAGLWPPPKEQIWNDQIPWLPIPVDYKPYEEDDLLNPGACPKRMKILKSQPENEEVKKIYISPHKDLMDYLEKNSGKPMRSPSDVAELYLILKTEEDTNFTLPGWTKSIYPEPIHSVAAKVYNYFNFNPEIRKINSGYFLKKILNDFKLKINGSPNLPKIYLYSGHESTLGHVLDALKVAPHVCGYGSAVLFELHKTDKKDNYIIKILYKRKTNHSNLEFIIYPGCEQMCSFSKLQDLIKDIIPDVDYYEACKTE